MIMEVLQPLSRGSADNGYFNPGPVLATLPEASEVPDSLQGLALQPPINRTPSGSGAYMSATHGHSGPDSFSQWASSTGQLSHHLPPVTGCANGSSAFLNLSGDQPSISIPLEASSGLQLPPLESPLTASPIHHPAPSLLPGGHYPPVPVGMSLGMGLMSGGWLGKGAQPGLSGPSGMLDLGTETVGSKSLQPLNTVAAAAGCSTGSAGAAPVSFQGLPSTWTASPEVVPAGPRGMLRAQLRYMSRKRVALYRKGSASPMVSASSPLASSQQLRDAVSIAVRKELSMLSKIYLQAHLQASISHAVAAALPAYLATTLPRALPAALPSLQPLLEPIVADALQKTLQQLSQAQAAAAGSADAARTLSTSGFSDTPGSLSAPGCNTPAGSVGDTVPAAAKAAAQMAQLSIANAPGARTAEEQAASASGCLPAELIVALTAQGGQASRAQLQAVAAGLVQRNGSNDAISAADVQHSLAQARLLAGRQMSVGPSPPPSLPAGSQSHSRAVSEAPEPNDLRNEQLDLDSGSNVVDGLGGQGEGPRRQPSFNAHPQTLMRQLSGQSVGQYPSGSMSGLGGVSGMGRGLTSQSTPLPGMGSMGSSFGSSQGMAAAGGHGMPTGRHGVPAARTSMPSLLQQQQSQQAQLAGLANLIHQQQQSQQHLAGLSSLGGSSGSHRGLSPSASSTFLAQQAAAMSSLHGSGGLSPGRMSPVTSPMAGAAHGLNVPLPSAGGGSMPALAQDAYLSLVQTSPQVAQELLSLVTLYQAEPAQTQHLLWVIFAELRAVALECPEVALALLRTLARHQGLALPTDIDQRVMGRMLQLMRHGPSGRQLCVVGLEQWADGLGRITKKTAYLDTILHNNQMTHKKLWAEAGEAVHQIDMRLPRQLLNEVPVPGLLMLSAELTASAHTLPDLQPRRWPDDAVWAIRQLYVLACTFTTLPMAAAADQAIAAAAAAAEPLPASLELFAADIKELMNQVATDVAAANAAMRTGMPLPMVPPAPAIGRFASLVAACSGSSGGPSGRGVGLGLSNKSAGLAPLEDANLQYVTFSPRLFEVLRRAQLRYYRAYMSAVLPGVYSAPVEALLLACPQDLLMPQYAEVVSAVAQLLAACALSSSDFDPWFYDDLYRCIDHFGLHEAVRRLRSGLLADSPLRTFTHKNKALSHIIKGMGPPM